MNLAVRMADQDVQTVREESLAGNQAFIAFHNLTPDGFMMFKPVRDGSGAIKDFEWIFVNRAAGAIVGREPEDLIGKHLLVEMPGNKDEGLFDAYVEVIEKGQTWQQEFHYDHGGISAWFRATAASLEGNLSVSFADISEVKRGHERLRNLIDSVIAFVVVLSPEGILREVNEPLAQAAPVERGDLVGKPFWASSLWDLDTDVSARVKEAIETANMGKAVHFDAEVRTTEEAHIWIDFQIVPVMGQNGEVVELIASGVDITERKKAEAHRELLIGELSHRVKNTLAIIQSIANQSTRSASTLDDFRMSFQARLKAIAACHDLLVSSEHHTVSLAALLSGQIRPFTDDDARVVMTGPEITLPGDVAYSLGLVLHELATNAAKYGALSVPNGMVAVTWEQVEHAGVPHLRMRWKETGGPFVNPPERQGFGTQLIERSLAALEGNGSKVEFWPTGVICDLSVRL